MFLVFICPALKGRVFTIGTELMRNVEEEVNIGEVQFYTFSGFSVSTAVFLLLQDTRLGLPLNSGP